MSAGPLGENAQMKNACSASIFECQRSADTLIGERDPLWSERAASSLAGLRLDWRRSGEARRSVGQPLWRELATAGDLVGSGIIPRKSNCFRCRCGSSGDELTERAVVVLMHARALRGAM